MKRFVLLAVVLLATFAFAGDPAVSLTVELPPSSQASISIVVKVPAAYKVSPDAPFFLDIAAEGPAVAQAPKSYKGKGKDLPYTMTFATGPNGQGALNLKMMLFVCQADHEGVCQKMDVQFKIPLLIKPGAASEYDIPIQLTPQL